MSTTVRIAMPATPQARVADKPADARWLMLRLAAAVCLSYLLARGVIACPKKL
jgi:hypothetical protein